MPRLPPLTLLTCLLSLAACHAAPPAEVPEYAALPGSTPEVGAAAAVHVEWANGLEALALSCGTAEFENGVDDNCDGHIDEGHGGTPGTLELALTWQGPSPLALSTEPLLDAATAVTCTEGASCIARLSSQTWSGADPLVVHVRAPAGDTPVRVSLSLAALGKPLGTHNVLVAAGETRELVRVAAR